MQFVHDLQLEKVTKTLLSLPTFDRQTSLVLTILSLPQLVPSPLFVDIFLVEFSLIFLILNRSNFADNF